MAVSGPFAVDVAQQFPFGLALVSEITKSLEYDPGVKREERRQDRDKDTGLPLWECSVLDLDPSVSYEGKTFVVRIASDVQPVAPAAVPGGAVADGAGRRHADHGPDEGDGQELEDQGRQGLRRLLRDRDGNLGGQDGRF